MPDMGAQNLNSKDCDKEHNLFLADGGYGLVQILQKQAKGVQCILSLYRTYIDTCASYASTPYPGLHLSLKKEPYRLVLHSNAGSCGMDSGSMFGVLKQVWLNKSGVAMIILLKHLEELCPVVYNTTHNRGTFICRTKYGNIVLKNNKKGMLYLDLREFKAKAVLSFTCKTALSLVQTMQGNVEGFTKCVKSRKGEGPARHRQCWGIPPTGTSWEWYVAA